VQIYGAWADDLEVLRLITPDGRLLVERRRIIPRDYAQWLAYLGRRATGGIWADGKYRGEYALYRGPSHEKVIAVSRETDVGPQALTHLRRLAGTTPGRFFGPRSEPSTWEQITAWPAPRRWAGGLERLPGW